MNLIKASYEILEQEPGIEGIFKQIERAGRTCYKSEDKITENSAIDFVYRMIKSKHTAMLEHGTVYLYFKHDVQDGVDMGDPYDVSLNLTLNRFTVHKSNYETHEQFFTTNLRVIVDILGLRDFRDFLERHAVDYDNRFIKRVTTKFICNRQVSHEFVRHRVFSFAQESTRYCNYTKDKFGGELTFIDPYWKSTSLQHEQLDSALRYAETYYKYLIEFGYQPQQAATVLPNAIKTELIMTGTVDQWDHFFDLRARETTGKAHPQAKELAEPLMKEFEQRKYLELNNIEGD